MKNYHIIKSALPALAFLSPLLMAAEENAPSTNEIQHIEGIPYKLDAGNLNEKVTYMVLTDMEGNKLWHRRYHPNATKMFLTPKGVIVQGQKTKLLDLQSGEELAEIDIKYRFSDNQSHIYGYRGSKNSKLVAYDLNTLQELWETKISKNSAPLWSVIEYPNDTTLIVSAENILRINLENGNTSELILNRSTKGASNKDVEMAIAAGGLLGGFIGGGIAGAILAGSHKSAPQSLISYPKFGATGSVVVTDSNGLHYVSDREKIVCFNDSLKELWSTPLPKKSGAYARLYLRGDTLDVLNTGMCRNIKFKFNLGKPFYASYSCSDGSQIAIQTLRKNWAKNVFGSALDFVDEDTYLFDEESGTYTPIPHHPLKYPVRTNDGKVAFIDPDFNSDDLYDQSEIFFKLSENADKITLAGFINGEIDTVEIDK